MARKNKRVWSRFQRQWCKSKHLRAIFFFDESFSISEESETELSGCRVLYPRNSVLKSTDEDILKSVILFIRRNKALIKNKVRLFFITKDHGFQESSHFSELCQEAGVDIQLVTIDVKAGIRINEYSPKVIKQLQSYL